MTKEHGIVLSLLRMAVSGKAEALPVDCDWAKVLNVVFEQGVAGITFEVVERLSKEHQPNLYTLMQWFGHVEYQKNDYYLHENAIIELSSLLRTQDIIMMILKGYGLSLYWPIPEHRPVGDMDVYFYGKWKQVDQLVHDKLQIEIDKSHHHHTCFVFHDVMVENHYDFTNVYAHSDARRLDERLKELAHKDSRMVEVDGAKVFLPSADLNALFLIRHMGEHFAGEKVTLRQLLDWHFFLQKEGDKVNWTETHQFLKEIGLFGFKEHINHICEYCFQGTLDSLSEIEERILNDVLSPEFSEVGKGVLFKWRRWKANIWKHRLVYNENLIPMFFTLALSHIKKP